MSDPLYLTAREAAAELNVSRATLYAYVSRGLIASTRRGNGRERFYAAEDIRRLRTERGRTAEPQADGLSTLTWGAPVLRSAITLIANGKLYYRGRDAGALARSSSFESVLSLLWETDSVEIETAARPALPVPPADLSGDHAAVLRSAMAGLAMVAGSDAQALARTPVRLVGAGTQILGFCARLFGASGPKKKRLADRLAAGWNVPAAADAINATLILCADHELNASAFSARCIAATDASIYEAVIGGLAALSGPRHGGASSRVRALFDELRQAESPLEGLQERLARGDAIPASGHPIYPDGDYRARVLMELLLADRSVAAAAHWVEEIAEETEALTGERMNIDFTLVALQECYRLPRSAPIALFALGRIAGWVAHVLEQYKDPSLIRPRALYCGEEPRDWHENRTGI